MLEWLFSTGSNISLVLLCLLAYSMLVFAQFWGTNAVVLELDTDVAGGIHATNGDPRLLNRLTGAPRAASTATMGDVARMFSAAVVVPSPRVDTSTDEGLSNVTTSRLALGLRLALITGAPWLFMTGTTRECAAGTDFLLHAMGEDGVGDLFRIDGKDGRWLNIFPKALHANVSSWSCLLEKQATAFNLAAQGSVPSAFRKARSATSRPGAHRTPQTVMEAKLSTFLETSAKTSHLPQTTRDLAAHLVSEHMHRRTQPRTNAPSQAADEDDGFVVYGSQTARSGTHTAGEEGDHIPPDDLWQYPRLWAPAHAAECGFPSLPTGTSEGSASLSDDSDGSRGRVDLVLPGLVCVAVDNDRASDEARAVAGVFYSLVENSVLARRRDTTVSGSPWWLLNNNGYGILTLTTRNEAQRVKMVYSSALRRIILGGFANLRTAVSAAGAASASGKKTAPSVREILPPFLLRATSLRGGLTFPTSGWTVALSRAPEVYVVSGADIDVMMHGESLPQWVSLQQYKEELRRIGEAAYSDDDQADSEQELGKGLRRSESGRYSTRNDRLSLLDDGPPPPDASSFARTLGLYAHYLYFNYYRQKEMLAAFLYSTAYYDFFALARDFAADIVAGRIDLRDFLFM